MIGVVLLSFPMFDLDETFSKACIGSFGYPDTNSSSIRNEHPYPPRLQEETWRIGGVLTSFLTLDLDETFSKAS